MAVRHRASRSPLLDGLRAAAAYDWTELEVADIAESLELLREVQGRLERLLVGRAEELARAQLTDDDMELDIPGLMKLGRRSRSWVEHNGHRVAGRHQPGGAGTRVTWSRREAAAWFRRQGTAG